MNISYTDKSCLIFANKKRCYINIISEVLGGCCILGACVFLLSRNIRFYPIIIVFSVITLLICIFNAYQRWKWFHNKPKPIELSKQKVVLPSGTVILCNEIHTLHFSIRRYGMDCYIKTKNSEYQIEDWQYYIKPKQLFLILKNYVPSLEYKRTW